MKKFRTIYYKAGKIKNTEPVRFAHISDLHGCFYGERQEGILEALQMIQPDAVMVSGDMITKKPEINERTVAFFEKVAAKVPVYFCNGNHETRYRLDAENKRLIYDPFIQGLKEAGVHCLNNESVFWECKGITFQVAGFEGDSQLYGRFSRKKPSLTELKEKLGNAKQEHTVILLSHNPMYFQKYQEWGADLCFSGHLHGGYIRLPFLGGVISPQVQLFPKYDRGLFTENKSNLCVSAGLGDHSRLPRLWNPAELPVVLWYE